MANVEKPKQANGGQQQPQQTQQPGRELARNERMPMAQRDPFEMMRDFMVDPFRAMREMMRMDRSWRPDFEVHETDDAYVIRADVPGLSADDLDITVTGNELQIAGKRDAREQRGEGRYHTYERSYGSFVRTFELSDAIDRDRIDCKLDNGVLELQLPKRPEAARQRKKIEINKSGGAGKTSH